MIRIVEAYCSGGGFQWRFYRYEQHALLYFAFARGGSHALSTTSIASLFIVGIFADVRQVRTHHTTPPLLMRTGPTRNLSFDYRGNKQCGSGCTDEVSVEHTLS